MRWLALRVVAAGADRHRVLAALFDAGTAGVQEDGDALVSYFAGRAQVERARTLVGRASPHAPVEVSPVPDVDWSEAWKRGLTAHRVGTLTVSPPWLAEGSERERTVVIEPAMAFGTGDHPTTRGALRLMEAAVREGDRVADLGAGSAVLAIAAAKLGAARVAAIELDPDAVRNAEENVVRNGVEARVAVIEGDARALLPLVAPVRLVLANIISAVVVELLPAIADALSAGGEAILGGMLVGERDEMRAVLAAGRWRLLAEDVEEEWWSARVARA
jgi:ribosomal protein L11 methyltransferase